MLNLITTAYYGDTAILTERVVFNFACILSDKMVITSHTHTHTRTHTQETFHLSPQK